MIIVVVLLQGCATGPLTSARDQFYSGQPEAALETLEPDSVSKRNILLAHLDRGVFAHTAGQYEQSIKSLKSAAALLGQLDYISIKEQSASLVANDWVSTYKGEYSERLWIHTFQMMNFLLINNAEGAAVEARQALKVYDSYSKDLKRDWYTRALIALSFEAAGKPDSAHIEYKKLLHDLTTHNPEHDKGVARRAWQNATRLGRTDDADAFKRLANSDQASDNTKGELVLFLQAGAIPPKIAGELYINPTLYASFPIYPEIRRPDLVVTVFNESSEQETDVVNVQLVDISRDALAARGERIALKQALRLAAKKNLADSIYDESEVLGAIFTIAFMASEIADTRSWESLPAQVSLVQVPLSEGTHSLQLSIADGGQIYDLSMPDITIKKSRKTYRSIRVGAGAPSTIGLIDADLSLANP